MNLPALLIRLYPAGWRARYGEEFAVLLEERPVGPFDAIDIALSAIDARLRLRGLGAETRSRTLPMTARIGGAAAIVGATLLSATALAAFGFLEDVGELFTPIVFVIGLVLLLVALAGLSAFQARAHPVLSWLAFLVPALGTVAAIGGLIGTGLLGEGAWGVWFIGTLTALAGSALFAVVTWLTAALSRAAALLLGLGSALPFVALVAPDVSFLPLAAVATFLLGWFLLGVQAIRLDRPPGRPHPA